MAKETKETTAVTVAAEAAVPAYFEGMKNTHDDDFGNQDFSYGWLRIAQSNTDQRKRGSEKYIDGLEEGFFFNSMTSEIYHDGQDPKVPAVKVVVLKFFRSYSINTDEQRPKFVRAVTPEEWGNLNLSRKGTRYYGPSLDEGECGQEQMNYMVYLPDHPDAGILRLAISPGGFAAAKSWNTLMSTKVVPTTHGPIKAPKHYQVWELHTKFNENDNGSYYTIGTGSTFGGKFLRFVEDKELSTIVDMVNMVQANESRLHQDAVAEETTDAEETDF